jgi:hypothetical protein
MVRVFRTTVTSRRAGSTPGARASTVKVSPSS